MGFPTGAIAAVGGESVAAETGGKGGLALAVGRRDPAATRDFSRAATQEQNGDHGSCRRQQHPLASEHLISSAYGWNTLHPKDPLERDSASLIEE
jgi:hypothetical protein